MTNEARGSIRLHSRGIGRAAAYFALAVALWALIMTLIRNPMESYGVSLAMSLFVIVPALLFAEYVSGEVVIESQGLYRTGVFGRKTVMPWSDVEKLKLVRNSAGMREMIVVGRRKKIVLSSDLFLIKKPNFWPAVFAVLDRPEASTWPIKTGILGYRAWFYHAFEFLPGDQFKDREEDIKNRSRELQQKR